MTPRRGDTALEVVNEAAPRRPVLEEPLSGGAPDPDEVDLAEYLDTLAEGRWIIAAVAAVCLVLGGAYAFHATPVYRASGLVQVEDKKANLGPLDDLFSEASLADTEIEILRSRSLVGGVVDELKLDIIAVPRRFPLIGGAIARRHARDDAPASPLLGLRSFGWGGERITVDRLELPEDLLDERLVLVAAEAGRYRLSGPDGDLLEGEVGHAASGHGVNLFVSELRARPGTQFRLERRARVDAIDDLRDDLKIAERGKKTGIIELKLDGPDRAKITAILDALSRGYVRQNVERKSAEAGKTLAFLETQLPQLRANLEATERDLEAYRSGRGSMDVTLETQAILTRGVEVQKSISELEVEGAELKEKFTANHPVMIAYQQKLVRLKAERDDVEARLKRLPQSEMETAKRLRDAKVANELYVALMNKAQELKVAKEGALGNVRILDAAMVATKPVSPKKAPTLALSLVLGLGLGVGLVFVRRALDQGVEDPDVIEQAIGIGVHASVPHSDTMVHEAQSARRNGRKLPLLAEVDPKDLAVESLRSLRTSLQFALLEASSNVITVSGPAPGIGKSFVAANLAHVLGETSKRVLVIDADLRRGHLHRFYGGDRAPGLSDVLGGHVPLEQAVRETASPNVRLLATGTMPPNPAELLGSERFQRVVAEATKAYDLVLIDTPPILAVGDAALVCRHAGVNLFVVKSGAHPVREIVAAIRQFGRNGIRMHGVVMNDVRLERGLGRRNAYHYQYRYD